MGVSMFADKSDWLGSRVAAFNSFSSEFSLVRA